MFTRLVVAVGTAIAVGVTFTPAHAGDGEGLGGIARMGGIARPVGSTSRPTPGMSRPSEGMSRPTPRGPARFSLARRTTVYRPVMPNRPPTSLSRPEMTTETNAAQPSAVNGPATPAGAVDRPGNRERSALARGGTGGPIVGKRILRGQQNRARTGALGLPGLGSLTGGRTLIRGGRGRLGQREGNPVGGAVGAGDVGIANPRPFGDPAPAGYPADPGPAALRGRSFGSLGTSGTSATGGGGWGGYYRRGGWSQGVW